jgi:hypothetical protein
MIQTGFPLNPLNCCRVLSACLVRLGGGHLHILCDILAWFLPSCWGVLPAILSTSSSPPAGTPQQIAVWRFTHVLRHFASCRPENCDPIPDAFYAQLIELSVPFLPPLDAPVADFSSSPLLARLFQAPTPQYPLVALFPRACLALEAPIERIGEFADVTLPLRAANFLISWVDIVAVKLGHTLRLRARS